MTSNIETVRKIYKAFGAGDAQGILDQLADDVNWESWPDNHGQNAGISYLKPQHGKAGVMEFLGAVARDLRVRNFEVLSLMEGGNQVVAEFLMDADVVPSGGHFRDEELHLFTFNDNGQVVRFRHYLDSAKHIAAWKGGR
jgi:ketosteroid isomerase-like protein